MKLVRKIKRYIIKTVNHIKGGKAERDINKFKCEFGLNTTEIRDKKIIISLASYKSRYKTIIPTLKSLLWQEKKPDRIIVWLDEDIPENKITEEMSELTQYGIEYRYTKENMKSHKKYFYSMQEFPDDYIITVDDDLIYSRSLVSSLVRCSEKNPRCICARRVHRIIVGQEGNILPYKEWEYESTSKRIPAHDLCATGCGGVLYPPHVLPPETFDIELIQKYCLNADDIWLKCMELLNDIKVVWVKNLYIMPKETSNSQESSLNSVNTWNHGNDEYLAAVMKLYPNLLEKISH